MGSENISFPLVSKVKNFLCILKFDLVLWFINPVIRPHRSMPSGKTGFSGSGGGGGTGNIGSSSGGSGTSGALAGGTYVKKEGPRKLLGES